MQFFDGESKGGDKYSAATAADELRSRPDVRRDWAAHMACSEAEVKKVFTKLSNAKKKKLREGGAQALLTSTTSAGAPANSSAAPPLAAAPTSTGKRKRGRPRRVAPLETDPGFAGMEEDTVPDEQLEVGSFE
jgi:hypothetical protein